ncbi:hypothetical protein CVE34_09235, partial [Pseudomonas syringae pv. actinidiae]|nr:hypothetical protein [Pseudomonas syringae pv. actinidiae]
FRLSEKHRNLAKEFDDQLVCCFRNNLPMTCNLSS